MTAPTTITPIRVLNGAERAEVSQAEMAELLARLVGQRLDRRYYDGPRLTADVRGRGHCFVRADIRRIDGEGIHCFFDSRCDLIPWADLAGVQFVYRDRFDEEIARGPMFVLAAAALQEAA